MNLLTLTKQLAYLVGFLIISWILVHFVAIFGIFLAAAIPVLHLIFYPKITCFWCQITNHKTAHSLRHSLIDSALVILLTTFSIGVVYGESKVLNALGFPATEKSVSFIIPSKGQYRLSEIFPMKIDITGIKVPVNAIQADLSFDPTALEVVDVTTESSFANIFLQKDFSNELGYVRLTGGLPNPGYSQESGVFGTIYFRGKKAGLTQVAFLNSSLVLANDGRGTNVLKDLARASYLITPDEISPAEKESQQDIIIRKQVLGDTTTETTLNFYAYTAPLPKPYDGVLGETASESTPKSSFSPIDWLAQIDKKIMEFWQSIRQLLS